MPKLLTYMLSFVYLGIYWNNHHHMLHAAERVSGAVLWANLHLLFWLSLVPAATGWMGEHHRDSVPAAVYGVVMFMSAIAYTILQGRIIACQGPHSRLRAAVQGDAKGKVSLVLYALGDSSRLRAPRAVGRDLRRRRARSGSCRIGASRWCSATRRLSDAPGSRAALTP